MPACLRCKYYYVHSTDRDGAHGTCQRFPPQLVQTWYPASMEHVVRPGPMETRWPEPKPGEECGEFKERDYYYKEKP
jgi:hypothetical protein